jgi:peptidoglycan/xylan/chitin deacetylase (PgdA/CDA1 family)
MHNLEPEVTDAATRPQERALSALLQRRPASIMPDDIKTGRLSRRGFLKGLGAFIASAPLHYVRPPFTDFGSVFKEGREDLPYISITIDDCYSLSLLQRYEEFLDAHPELRVTFFPVGTAISRTNRRDPGIWRRLYDKRHEFGYHGYTHQYPSLLSTNQNIDNYENWSQALAEALGFKPAVRFARPPYGDISQTFVNLCQEKDLIIAMWSVDIEHPEPNIRPGRPNIQNGDVILFHLSTFGLSTLERILPKLEEQSLRAVTITQLYTSTLL